MPARFLKTVSAVRRVEAAREFLLSGSSSEPFLAVGHTRAAADSLAMEVVERREGEEASFGAYRYALGALAFRFASPAGVRMLGPAARDALVLRLVHRSAEAGRLGRFQGVAEAPGLPRRLAATFRDLRLAQVEPEGLEDTGPELAALYRDYVAALDEQGFADRARILELAARSVRERPVLPVGARLLLLDVPITDRSTREFVEALAEAAPEVLITAPEGDAETEAAVLGWAEPVSEPFEDAPAANAVEAAQRHLFRTTRPEAELEGLSVVAAPGPLAEAIEIASALMAEARRGIRFDRMAVLLPTAGGQAAAFRDAFARAGIPAFFQKGARLPHPAGRAFLLLLDCAIEGLPSTRLAEYLAFGETPTGEGEGFHPPRRWERMVRDASVVGGLDRWERRLGELEERLARDGEGDEGPGSAGIRRQHEEIRQLSRTVMPILRELAALPERADGPEWRQCLGSLARSALRHPEGVLECIEEAAAGEATLGEIRQSLAPRLGDVVFRSGRGRFGSVWIGPVEAARGLAFDVVAVPGLTERAFPRVIREDPLLPDRLRECVSSDLVQKSGLGDRERLRLRLAVGAASGRLIVSYASLDAVEGRVRVPSYYLAEVFRAGFGRVPSLGEIRKAASRESRVVRGIRAPTGSASAIDRREFDLSRVAAAIGRTGSESAGAAAYLLSEPALARALRQEYMRQARKWQSPDGFLNPGAEARAALEAHRPATRSFSPTGLEAYATCPYQFFLKNVARLSSPREPEPGTSLDPLTRGSLLHEIFYLLGGELREAGLDPLPAEEQGRAFGMVRKIFAGVEEAYRARIAPVASRVWRDEMDGLLADLHGFLERHAGSGRSVVANELAFGMRSGPLADRSSTEEAPTLPGGLLAHGSIDAVEQLRDGSLQVTDYKTGRMGGPETSDGAVRGGKSLQPVVYAYAYEAITGRRVSSARLYYATIRGVYQEIVVNTGAPGTRATLEQFASDLDQAIVAGKFAAAPNWEGRFVPCNYCDYQPICGPRPAAHGRTKPRQAQQLEEVIRIRELP